MSEWGVFGWVVWTLPLFGITTWFACFVIGFTYLASYQELQRNRAILATFFVMAILWLLWVQRGLKPRTSVDSKAADVISIVGGGLWLVVTVLTWTTELKGRI